MALDAIESKLDALEFTHHESFPFDVLRELLSGGSKLVLHPISLLNQIAERLIHPIKSSR